jgi:uncharacterized protein YbgA (DUF1722 family)/uncharacterized protein YbbK (DUF523 family)
MTGKIKIGISSCLLGERVRYDGSHKLDRYITETLGTYYSWIPVCPEVESGLPVPREAMRLVGNPQSPRIVTRKTKSDKTEQMQSWTAKRLRKLEREDLCGFIFKSRSPSSGFTGVKVYTEGGMPSMKGKGIFGMAFTKHFPLIPVIDDGRLHNPALRENFIEKVFTYHRWKIFAEGRKNLGDLVRFHATHKLLIMAHSPRHYSILGRLVAEGKKKSISEIYDQYITLLMEAMAMTATVKKNTNVLQHMMGYFKGVLTSDEKKELLEIINNYHKALIPLIVPVTVINHYVRKFDELYLKDQVYLNPHPLELMLRNHV